MFKTCMFLTKYAQVSKSLLISVIYVPENNIRSKNSKLLSCRCAIMFINMTRIISMINEINDGEFFKLGDKCLSRNLY